MIPALASSTSSIRDGLWVDSLWAVLLGLILICSVCRGSITSLSNVVVIARPFAVFRSGGSVGSWLSPLATTTLATGERTKAVAARRPLMRTSHGVTALVE